MVAVEIMGVQKNRFELEEYNTAEHVLQYLPYFPNANNTFPSKYAHDLELREQDGTFATSLPSLGNRSSKYVMVMYRWRYQTLPGGNRYLCCYASRSQWRRS